MVSLYIRTLLIAFITLGVSFSAQPASAGVLDKQVGQSEASIQKRLRAFRLIKTVESFPGRPDASQDIHVDTRQGPAIATLHSKRNGQPLESCMTPCTLHGSYNKWYRLSVYKDGFMPKMLPIEVKSWAKRARKVNLGQDFNKVMAARLKCYRDFQKSEKVDGDAKPCLRVPPRMPVWAKKSGHCKMVFDVTAEGRVTNVKTKSCTYKVLKSASIRSVNWWYYNPKVDRGVAVERLGMEAKVSFRLTNARGKIIPETSRK